MKRYAVFAGATYYPAPGWGDFKMSFDTADRAKTVADLLLANMYDVDWWQIIDLTNGEIVVQSEDL